MKIPPLTACSPDEESGWTPDLEGIEHRYPWLRDLALCPQDLEFHGEGSVLEHTRAVTASLVAMPRWRSLPREQREIAFAAALMHDIGKPATTREEGGRLHSYGHSRAGALMARTLLWEMNIPFQVREAVCALIRCHTKPFWLLENDGRTKRTALQILLDTRIDLLDLVARADNLGRQCASQAATAEMLELAYEYLKESACSCSPSSLYPLSTAEGFITSCTHHFANDESRFRFFRNPALQEPYHAYPSHRCTVLMLSGLPGSGKDHWIQHQSPPGMPVISLDAIRRNIGAKPSGDQGIVIARAKEEAREYLRSKKDFVWNATNLSRQIRSQLIDLFTSYEARVEIVYLECTRERLFEQNRNRSHPVPEKAIERLLSRWEIPDFTEAHSVRYVVNG